MFELRWKVEEWEEYRDGLQTGIKHIEKPVLQYRTITNFVEIGLHPPIWTEWIDVPTVVLDN